MIPPGAGRNALLGSSRETCIGCRFFLHEPLALERALPGLASLSSAYASVRDNDGLCAVHDRYVAASSSCVSRSAAQAA
jgi:hypothetical protein